MTYPCNVTYPWGQPRFLLEAIKIYIDAITDAMLRLLSSILSLERKTLTFSDGCKRVLQLTQLFCKIWSRIAIAT